MRNRRHLHEPLLGLESKRLACDGKSHEYWDVETEETPRWLRQPPTNMPLIWTSSSIH